MDEKELERLRVLRAQHNFANQVCNPYEFQRRRDVLLDQIVEYFLQPLDEFEKEKNSKLTIKKE